MDIEISQIKKRDFNTARKFAVEGMYLNRYSSNKFELYICKNNLIFEPFLKLTEF